VLGIDAGVDEPAGARQAETPVAARDRLVGDHVGDVEPGERPVGQVGQRLVDRVVGTDEEVGAGRRQGARRPEHELGHARQIAAIEAGDVV
jgi:hypothetical protein